MYVLPITLLLLSIVHSCLGVCRSTPIQHELTDFKTFRYFCEYHHQDKMMGPTKIKLRRGSVFETVDSCQRCRCTQRGLDCCEVGLKVDVPPSSIPIECHVVEDGCDQYLVLKSDNITDCATGRPARMVRQEQMAEDRRRQYIEEILYKETMRAAGLSNGANADGEGNPFQQWILLDYFLNDAFVGRIPSPVEQQNSPGLAVPLPVKPNLAESSLGAVGKEVINKLGGPEAARTTLMNRIKQAKTDVSMNQRPVDDNLGLLLVLSLLSN